MPRKSGILLHISSLPNDFGFGSMGKEAYEFVNFLHSSGFKIWQVLPLNPTNKSGSPFQSYSVFAGNINLIDITPYLTENELKNYILDCKNLNKDDKDIKCNNFTQTNFATNEQINFLNVTEVKVKYLKNIFDREKNKKEIESFKLKNNYWLEDYSTFCAIKDVYNVPYWKFPHELSIRDNNALLNFKKSHKNEIDFYIFTQYLFFEQWQNLKNYANSKDVQIFGDLAFYPAGDSCDVWANKQDFCFDENNNPKGLAGVPPDYFSKDGQVWGSPVYNVKEMKKNNYNFWTKRLEQSYELFDIVRLDHFRGFESFWVVSNYKAQDAKKGKWVKGLGADFFKTLKNKNLPIIVAEDLGIITKKVKNLKNALGIAGMKVLQFAFDGNAKNSYLPHNFIKNCVAYLGTHDNNTFLGFLKNEVNSETKQKIKSYFMQDDNATDIQILKMSLTVLLNSVADTVILTMQDVLFLEENYRTNTPSTVNGNWCFRLKEGYNLIDLQNYLLKLNISAGRV